jgi:segregation and condensation protein A
MLYQIALDSFHGPLDLLLYLVKRNEMDVRDISVAQIAEQFLEHLHAIQAIDIEWAGDFLVMAATLLEIKSKLLLPRAAPNSATEDDDDPRKELVKQLIEYRKTKDASGHLERLAEERQFHIARTPPDDEEGATSPRLRRVELWDLVSAFGRLMRETQALQPQHIVVDETPQAVFQEQIHAKLASGTLVAFRALFDPPFIRHRMIGYFLALLELIKIGLIELEQAEPFAPIFVRRIAPRVMLPDVG